VPKNAPVRALITTIFLAAFGCGIASAEDVPLPRPRPPAWAEPLTFREAAGPDFNSADVTSQPSDCRLRLEAVAAVEPMPRLVGPGACGGGDMVQLDAVLLPDGSRVAVESAAVLNCAMAESFAGWLRDEAAPRLAKLGSPLRAVENYDSYECRSRNRIAGAKLSDHAHGDAIDVRAFHLADGRRLELTDVTVDKPLREALRETACRRFTTVLGPGADSYHDGHIHLDLIQRHNGYRICEWDVREPPPPSEVAEAVPLPTPRPNAAGAPVKDGQKL
jgi:hypothetical protein